MDRTNWSTDTIRAYKKLKKLSGEYDTPDFFFITGLTRGCPDPYIELITATVSNGEKKPVTQCVRYVHNHYSKKQMRKIIEKLLKIFCH